LTGEKKGAYIMTREERQEKTNNYINLIEDAYENGSIYNADYTKAKDWLKNRWEDELREAKWSWWDTLTKEQKDDKVRNDLLYKFPSITQIAGYVKFLGKLDAKEIVVILEVVKKWTPISEMLVDLKTKTIKGRKPSDTPRKVNEHDEDKMTCPCCFGRFHVTKSGRMVRHGWTSYHGWQQGECFGWWEKPYEVSCEGTRKLRERLEESNEGGKYNEAIAMLKKMEESWKPQK
jgi:hypothetical protein